MLYFAYGSNLNLSQMAFRCPDSEEVGPGLLKGWKLAFRGPLDIYRDKQSQIMGFVFRISKGDLKALDRYEGYPRLYTRIKVPVQMTSKNVKALVYTMTGPHKIRTCLPSKAYLQTVMQGYCHCGLADHRMQLFEALATA